MFINYAEWKSVEHFKQATSDPVFRFALAHYPDITIGSPHLFRKVAVPGICIDWLMTEWKNQMMSRCL